MNWNKRSIETDPFSFVDLSAEGMRSTACEPFSREPFRAKDHINFQKDLYFQFGTVYFQSEPPTPITGNIIFKALNDDENVYPSECISTC